MRRCLVALALAFSIPASASTYTVDHLGDAPDFNPGDDVCSTAPSNGVCTLRAAIMESNANADFDEIVFDVAGTILPGTDYPSITDPVTIEGRGAPGYAGAPVVIVDGAGSVAIGLHFDLGSDESELIALEISGFSTAGVLADADTLSIRNNYLGPVSGGGPNGDGLQLNGNGSTVGGSDDGGNIISGNDFYGILVTGTNHDIRDNFIGTDAAGTSDLANGEDGISIDGGATGVTIGSETPGEENVISGNFDTGISIDDGSGNTIAGNYIGLDVTGTAALPNFIGIEVHSAGNTIGTTAAANVISGNDDDGIDILANDTVVQNNIIGLDATGTVGVGNFGFGIAALVVSNVEIGGSDPGEGNVVSFNGAEGIFFLEVDASRITGNIVGLDAAGTNILGNGLEGILLLDTFDITVDDNTVSGNSSVGIVDAGGIGNIFELNRVGTTHDGNGDAGNLDTGIEMFFTLDAIVRSNVVSANAGHGIEVTFGAFGTLIHSNIVGLGADLTTELGNFADGVNVCDGAEGTVVGSVAHGGNTITGSGANGIGVEPSALQNNSWGANSIYDNELLGIDLGQDDVTPNDEDDPDTGPNNLQNFPELDSAATTATASFVRGTLNTVPNSTFRVHFYSSPAADPSGFGEGQTWLGFLNGTTDANGDASFVFTGPALTVGHVVTATATTGDGTSEFSAAENVVTAPTISFSSATYTESEAAGTATITVTRSGNLDLVSTVDFATSNDTAIAGSDYIANNGTLTFESGDDTETFTVAITNDALDEPIEVVDLTLSNATSGGLAAPFTAELSITDDDDPPSIDIDDVSQAEDGGSFVFTVTLSGPSGFDVTVEYDTADDTAVATSDYTAQSGTATINAGDTTATITVPVTADAIFEDDETFFVDLSNPSNATIDDGQGLGTIENDDTQPTVSIDNPSETEGTDLVFTLTLSGTHEDDVVVSYTTADGTATAGDDYTAQTDTATITAGTTSTTITVPTAVDALFEADETLFVNLTGATNATIADEQGIGTIENDDMAPTLSIDDVSEAEGTDIVFTVTLSAAAGVDVTFDFDTANDTAAAGDDYTAQSSSGTITAGNTSTTITVSTTADTLFELDETFFVNLSSPGNATIADGEGTGTIENDDPMPTLDISDLSQATEDLDNSFNVFLSTAAGVDVTFTYTTTDGTATAGDDYTAQSDSATITAGSTSTSFTVPHIDDALSEDDETYVVTISDATNATITDAESDAGIIDNDPMPSVTIEDESIAEGENLVFTVTLSAVAGVDVTVNFETADDTASESSDYTAQSGVATIPAGSLSTTITVPTTEDTEFETDETLFVDLTGATNATVADNRAVGTIENDEGVPTITIGNATETEGNDLVFTVTLSEAAGVDVTVSFETADDTATAGDDYTAQSGVATITAGSTSTTITVPGLGDALFELDETFFVDLSGATNAAIGDDQALGTIEDDDAMPSISIDDPSSSEGNEIDFTVTLSAPAGVDVTVDFATANDTATAGSDYTAQSGTAVLPAGSMSTTITVPTMEDALFENDETLLVDLSNAANATIADDQGLGTIENDDAMPEIAIADDAIAEGDELGLTILMSGVAGVDVTVDYATADDTATAGSDYTAQSGTATIPAGSTFTTVTVPITEDPLFEGDETLFVNLSGATNATIIDDQGLGTILDDDGATPIVTISNEEELEGDTGATTFTFTLTLSAPSGSDVLVDFETADGSAEAGSDYDAASGQAVIPSGSTTAQIVVDATGDELFEDDETFVVNLTSATNAVIADNQGLGTILNDDGPEPTADLSISKTTTATTFTPGQQITYTLTVENAGPLAAADITVTDVLPAGLSLVSASGDGAVCTGTSTVTCTIATLAADATAVITLVTVASGTEPITNTATVSAAAPDDTATANNSAFAVIAPAGVTAAGIPTLSEWALLVLAMALAGLAVRRT